jgi:hypothetical protein
MRVVMYPSASGVKVLDNLTSDYTTLAATSRNQFDSVNIMDRVSLQAASATPTVDIEIYFGQ